MSRCRHCFQKQKVLGGLGESGLQRALDAARPLRISRAQSTSPEGVLEPLANRCCIQLLLLLLLYRCRPYESRWFICLDRLCLVCGGCSRVGHQLSYLWNISCDSVFARSSCVSWAVCTHCLGQVAVVGMCLAA